jgi:hypothetical protein
MASSMVIAQPTRAQPNMGPPIGSVVPDLGMLPLAMPGGLSGDGQNKRVKDLEEEVRFLKTENEKQVGRGLLAHRSHPR